MQNTLPEVGKIYVSRKDPTFKIYVERVDLLEADEDMDAGFFVEGCDPKDIGDMSGIAYDFLQDEWIDHDFSPV